MSTEQDPFICYVLMRTDLPDYMSGKSMAQAHHAGTHFTESLRKHIEAHPVWIIALEGWLFQGGRFGTTIILGVTYPQLRAILEEPLPELFSGLVHDSSYPVRDGDRINHMPVDTCGYVFGRLSYCQAVLSELPLFREPDKG